MREGEGEGGKGRRERGRGGEKEGVWKAKNEPLRS